MNREKKRKTKATYSNGRPVKLFTEEIVVTKHALERLKLRVKCDYLSDDQIRKRITQDIRQSIVIQLKQDSEEIRDYKGVRYACVREKGYLTDKLIVKTVLLSKLKEKELFSKAFDGEIDYEAMDYDRKKFSKNIA